MKEKECEESGMFKRGISINLIEVAIKTTKDH